jgi:DNA-binding NtrC family response regulator
MKTIDERSPINVLIIEDNIGDFFLIQEYLKEVGSNFIIKHCENLEHALQFLKEQQNIISIIFSDYHLPDSSDLNLVKKIKVFFSEIPLIIMSGDINQEIIEESKKMGAFDFLLKDELNPTVLKKTIEDTIQKMAS